ncbi:MAG: zinc ABC transporter substrate-binding protein [Rhodobacteraceae bacterium]|nr:zinc ABC transporter substrate-binding protein [Paracoccaceae bacterium]
MAALSRRALLGATIGFSVLPGVSFAAGQPVSVVATTGMIADAVRQVGGDLVEVKALMGPGVDPHAYRQTRTDIAAMVQADLVLWHGLYLEAQMEDFLIDLGKDRKVMAAAEGLSPELLIAHEDYADKFDPHVWMDPELWALVVRNVQTALTEAHPDAADQFAANAQAHLEDLAQLKAYSADSLSSVPAEARVLVTAHDAFGYFGREYGFEVLGIQGISTQSEAGLARVAELVDLLVDRKIGAVFVESSVTDRNIRALIEGAAAQGHEVTIGGELFSDAMGPDGSYEGTYLGMIDHNVTTIARALGADGVPATGMNGKLGVSG